jgi:outer membrane protein TolC
VLTKLAKVTIARVAKSLRQNAKADTVRQTKLKRLQKKADVKTAKKQDTKSISERHRVTAALKGIFKMKRPVSRIVLSVLFVSWNAPVFAMDLQEYLKTVETKHKTVQSLSVSQEAADLREEAGDIELVPTLTAGVSYLNDKSPLSQFALLGATESKNLTYSLGMSKRFSSGTTASIYGNASEFENIGIADPMFQKFGVGALGVSLSQSLWRDAFGRATRLRWERTAAATKAEKGTYDLQKRLLLIEAETAFWNYFLAEEALRIGRSSLDRSKKIEGWTKRRVGDGISDRADLLETQGLVSARQLQLITVQDEQESAKRQIRDFLDLGPADDFPVLNGDISQNRALNSLVDGKKGKVVALEAYLSSLNAKARSIAAREVEEAYRPDLVLSGAYNTNSVGGDMPGATSHLTDTQRPTARVALNINYMFDTSVKKAAKDAARKDALAAQLVSEQKMLDSDSAWIELNRRYIEMSKRVDAASDSVRIQTARSKAQTDLFNKGRSITFNVVNAEEDVATAELNLYRLKSEQRKMEAQGRLFITLEE